MKRLLALCLVLSAWTAGAQTPNIFAPAAGSYGTAANWSLGHVPDSNDVAVISVTNNAVATNSAGTFAAGALVMGANTRTGNLVVTGGQLSYGAASTIATNGSTANLINSGGSVIFSNGLTLAVSAGAATSAAITNQSGTVRVEGNLQLGVHNLGGGGARGFLTVNGGTVTVTGNLATCNASSFSYVRLNGGVLELAGVTHGGSATERVLFFNGGTLRALRDNAAFLPVAANAVQMTNAVQNGGAVIDSQGFAIAVTTPFLPAAGQTGGLTKVGGGLLELTANSLYTGVTRVAAGTLRLSGSGALYNSGTLAGQVIVEPGAAFALARHDALGNHASVSPVVVTVPTNALVVNSNTFTTLRNPVLRGGELRAVGGASATYGSYQFKGTVTVAGDSTSLISAPAGGNGFSQVQLGNNAAGGQTIFDVADGAAAVDLQIDPALVDGRNAAGSATVPSGLIKSGAGVMVVTSNNTFTGTASVNAGTLRLGANASVAGELAVATGAVLDVSAKPTLTLGAGQVLRGSGLVTGNVAVGATSQLRAGGVNTPGTLTVGGNLTLDSAYESVFDLTNSTAVGGGTNDLVVVTGDLDAGLGTIRINPLSPLVSGTYRLLEYTGTETLPFSGGLVGLNTRDTATLDETTPGQVNLIVVAGAAQALAWNPAVDGNWDYGTQNWLDAGTRSVTEQFYDLDTVLFDEAGAFNNVVNVTTNLRPAAIFVTGGSNYTFTGNGRIQDQQGGATALGKDGPGELTLGTTNTFSGGIVVSNGLLVAGVGGALGGGAVTLLGGQLALAAPMTVTNMVALQAPTVSVDDRGNAVTLAALVSGPGQLIKSGGGTLTLGVANTYTGGTVISAGTLRQAVPGALGTAPGPIILGDAGSGTNAVAWRFAAGLQPSNAITVTALGTGPASLGSYNNSTFTEHRGPIALARAVTLADGTTDRTSFTGPITGAPGLITISGTRITLDNPSNSFVAGLLINGGSIYQNNNTSALPFATTITNNGAFRLNNGGRHVVDALGGTGTVDIVAGGVSTLSLGNGNGSDVFAGRIANGAAALSLEKKGAGVQTLSNTNSYTGNTTILGGTLALSGLATLAGTPQILVGASGIFDVSARPGYTVAGNQILYGSGVVTGEVVTAAGAQVRPGGFNFASTLTFKNSLGLHAGTTNWFDLTGQTSVGGGTNDLVVVDGLLEPSNSVIQVNVLQPLTSGVYTLFTYTGAKTTTFNPAPILSLSPGRKTVTVDETVAGQVNLNVTGSYGDLVWLPQTNAAWDFVVNNWSNLASAALDTFFQSDAVTFDERGAYSNVVTLTTTTQPARVTVAGASNYVFQGAGGIGGIGGLVKSGAGLLVVANTNTYQGVTTISNGTLQVGNGGTAGQLAGTGVIQVESGGTLINFRSDLYTAGLTLSRSVAGAGNWIVRGSGGSLTSDYLITGSQTGFTGSLTIDKARFQADALSDFGPAATINVVTGGQFWASTALTVSNTMTLDGLGWAEGAFYGALRLQSGASCAGPITLAGYARIGSINGTHYVTSNISGPYDLEAYGGPSSGNLMLAGQNTFNNLRVVSYWTYVRGPASVGTGDVVMAGGGFSSYGDDLTLTNDLLATTTVYVGQDQAGVGVRSMTWAGNWNLGGALRQVSIYNTNTLLGAVTNGGMEVRQDGLLVLNGDVRLSDLYINQNGANGFVRQDGGTVVVANAGGTGFRIGHWSTTGAYTMNGGLLSNANGRLSVAWDGTGTLSVNGGTVVTPHLVVNDNGVGGAGILNLNGGTVVIGSAGLTTVGGPATVNLNGGTLGASANWASALPLIANGTNGATMVNPAGYTVTLHGALSGTGAVQQAGGGMLILNGAYAAGPLTVSLGTLAGTGTISAAATVAAGGTLQPGTPAAAGFLSISSVTFAAGAQFNPLLPGTGALLRVTATNGLTLPAGGAVATVNVANASLAVGTYPILDYAGAVQGGDVTNLVLGTLPPRTVMYLTNNTVNTAIELVVVTAGEPIKWVGNVNGQWNIEAPTNWVTTLGGLPTAYLQAGALGDALQFDDTAAGNFSITLQTNVSPASMLVSNDANDYAIGGGFGIGGAMALRKFGTARLTLETSNSFAGGTLVAAGTLQFGNGGVGGAPGSGPISNNASLVFVPGDTVSVAAVISGAGTLSMNGAGKLTLSADNTYTGATVVNRGVLELNSPNFNTYRGGVIAINSGATFRVAQSGGALRYDFPGKTFAFDSAGGGVMEFGAGLNFTFTGGGCTFTTAGGAENRLQGLSGVNMANNSIVFAVEPGTDAVALAVSVPMGNSAGGLTKLGAGLLSLSATNTFTGSTVLNGGTLRVEDSGKLYHGGYQPSAVVTVRSNAVLDLATWSYSEPGAEPLGGLRANSDAIVLDGGVVRMRKTTSYYRGFTLGAAGARLEPAANTVWTIPYTSTTAIISSSGGSLVLAGAGTGVLNKIFPGTGGLVMDGTGTWMLGATNTYGGLTLVSNGTLLVQGATGTNGVGIASGAVVGGSGVVRGAVTQDGVIAPGAGIGTLTISNQVTDGATAVYRFELGGTNAPTDYDQLVVSDVHTLQGTLEVVVTNGYVPASGDRFVILTNSGLGGLLFGTFSSVSAPALTPGLGWEVQYTGTESASLVVTGTVSGGLSAYEQWAQSIPNPAERGEQADPDGDGYANLLEYSQGTDATNSSDNAKLALVRTNGQFLVLFNRVNSATDIVYEVEGAYLPTNNATWLGIATNVIGSWGGSTNVNDNNTAAVHRVLVTDLLIGTNRSLRLKVTRP